MPRALLKRSVYSLKPRFQRFLQPIERILIRADIAPNYITITACLLSLLYGASLIVFDFSPALLWGMPLFLFIRMALNALDGMVAVKTLQASSRGAFLNEISDIFSDLVLYLPFAYHALLYPSLVVAVLFSIIISEFIGLACLAAGKTRRFEGPFGKSDRAIFFALLSVVIALCAYYPGFQNTLLYLLIAALILSTWTIFNRCVMAWKSLA